MSLSDFQVDTVPIIRKGQTLFTVRGLNIEDLTSLTVKNLPAIQEAFKLYNDSKIEVFTQTALNKLILSLTVQLPGLVAEVISQAADEPEAADKARKLPMPLQVLALTEIVNLTFEEVGDLKNLFATLASKVKAVDPDALAAGKSLLTDQLSKGSIGAADET